MEVYVVGSLEPPKLKGTDEEKQKLREQYCQNKETFPAACQALGYALAKKGHKIVVSLRDWKQLEGGTEWDQLDHGHAVASYVLAGANQAAEKLHWLPSVVFDVPETAASPDAAREMEALLDKSHKVRPKCKPLRVAPSSGVAVSMETTRADAFILVGGSDGTRRVGYAAYMMRKPVAAVTSFGRAAEDLYTDMLSGAYGEDLAGETTLLQTPWAIEEADGKGLAANREHATKVVELTERIASSMSRRSRKENHLLATTIFACCILIVGWVWLYLWGKYQEPRVASIVFFLLLFISAWIGTNLRVLVAYQGNTIARLTWSWLGVELAVSLMLAYGLALIYLIGGITFTGNVVIFDVSSGSDTFVTLALSMSLLGLAAGFLAPVDALRRRLEKALEERQEGGQG